MFFHKGVGKKIKNIEENIKNKVFDYLLHLQTVCDEQATLISSNKLVATYYDEADGKIHKRDIGPSMWIQDFWPYYQKDKRYTTLNPKDSTNVNAASLCKKILLLYKLNEDMQNSASCLEVVGKIKNFLTPDNRSCLSYSRSGNGKSQGATFIENLDRLVQEFDNNTLQAQSKFASDLTDSIFSLQ